jgi:hypothetical protein
LKRPFCNSRLQQFDPSFACRNQATNSDFGSLDYEGQRIFWKIDYYDRASFGTGCDMGSDDPADPAKTLRVLTIMLASEY